MTDTELRLARAEYMIKHLLEAVQEHGEIHRNIENRNGYSAGFPNGLISDELEWVDKEFFNENEETEDDDESEEVEDE